MQNDSLFERRDKVLSKEKPTLEDDEQLQKEDEKVEDDKWYAAWEDAAKKDKKASEGFC
jgi:hypothetical protein